MINKPELIYLEGNLRRWTFDEPRVKSAVQWECINQGEETVINLFAGKNRLGLPSNYKEVRIDISDEWKPDFNVDTMEWVLEERARGNKYKTLIYDPPFSDRKSKEFYNGKRIGVYTKMKDPIADITKVGGIIIGLGHEISNFGKKRGFIVERLYVINPFGEIRPFFISVERKVRE